MIGGQTFTINQGPREDCVFGLNPASIRLPAKGGSKTIKVEDFGTTCNWSAFSNDPFITITAGASGVGDGTVGYTVAGNTNTSALFGTMIIADQTFTVGQAAGGCTFLLSPKTVKFKAPGGSKVIKVRPRFSDCAWTAVSSEPFITITAGASGVGMGAVSYTVAGNTNSTPLTGTITIGGRTFTITESGVP